MNQETVKAAAGDTEAAPALGMPITVLSVGAIEPGLRAAAESFQREAPASVSITFANTPAIRLRLAAGATFDLVIAPPAAIDDFTRDGKVIGDDRVYVGRVGVGVMVREGATVPDISSGEAVRRAVLDAESVIFNRSSSGLAAEAALKKLGVLEHISAKTTRFEGGHNGRDMMAHMANGKCREIGFGAMIEILLFQDRGVKLVGPLPPDIQQYTPYMAAPMAGAANESGGKTFMRYLASPAAKALFVAHGID